MKKIFQYSFAALAGLVLASCNGEYLEWDSPQSYSQEDPASAYGVSATANSIKMPTSDDDVTFLSFSASSEDVKGYNIRELNINQMDFKYYNVVDNNVIVSASYLEDLTVSMYASRASVARSLDIDVEYGAILKNGDAVAGKTSLTGSLTPRSTPAVDANGYYLLGSFAENGNGWDLTAPVWMTDNGDGTYSAIVNTTGDGDNWYKFYEGSHYSDSNWDEVNAGQMGCKDNGDPANFGLIVWSGDKYDVQTPVIQGKGQFKITIDMVNFTYKVTRQAVNYYIVGGPNDWAGSAANKELKFNQANIEVPVYTIVFPAVEGGDTWFAIGDDKACDAITNDGNWKLLYGTTSGNGNQGASGTLARRDALSDDGSFKVEAGAKFIKVTLNMDDMTYTCAPLNFGEYVYEAGTNNDWGAIEQPLYCPDGEGTYTGFFYLEGADWNGGLGAFKIQSSFNSWDNNYGYAGGNETSGILAENDGDNISVTPGFYRADIDLANMTYKMTPINSIFVVGSAVNNDWDVGVEMTYNVAERCWECKATLNDGQIKFKGNGTWDSIDGNWGGTLDNIINGSNDNIDVPVTGEVLIKFYPRCDTKSYATITPAN